MEAIDNLTTAPAKTALEMMPARLLVTRSRVGEGFVLRVVKGGQITERVTTMDAQMLRDYAAANWPIGTQLEWAITPKS